MDRIPAEVLYREAFHQISRYFAKDVEEKRRQGLVPVLINDHLSSFYYFPCNRDGFPERRETRFMFIPPMETVSWHSDGEPISESVSITVEELSVVAEKPLLSSHFYWQPNPVVFLWEGRIVQRQKVPLETLNIKELMKLAQAAITKRESLVIDEAFKNKIYK